jgi:hypothetical protein
MFLDLDGHIIVGGKSYLTSLPMPSGKNGATGSSIQDTLQDLSSIYSLTTWERKVTRLCQRVQEVNVLIQEDLQEILEPLCALGNMDMLSSEQATQLQAALVSYERICLECEYALNDILLPFHETIAL